MTPQKYVGRIETDEETGVGTITDLAPGKYTIREVVPAKGTTLDTGARTVILPNVERCRSDGQMIAFMAVSLLTKRIPAVNGMTP